MTDGLSAADAAARHSWRADLDRLVERYRTGAMPQLGGPHRYDPARAAGFRQAAVLALFTPSAVATAPPAHSLSSRMSSAPAWPASAAPASLPTSSSPGVDLFLVQRSPHLLHHPGQIALPGGGIDAGESAVEAAVREGEEETGVPATGIEVAGRLGNVLVPVSDNIVTPVIGWCDEPGNLPHTDTAEVLLPLRVPVAELLDPANRATITFMSHRSAGFRVPTGWVWGFTGNLLDYLFEQLDWTIPWDREVTQHLTLDEARGRGLV